MKVEMKGRFQSKKKKLPSVGLEREEEKRIEDLIAVKVSCLNNDWVYNDEEY